MTKDWKKSKVLFRVRIITQESDKNEINADKKNIIRKCINNRKHCGQKAVHFWMLVDLRLKESRM